MAGNAVATFEKCPRCEARPASPGGNHWCLECRAEYKRDYDKTKLMMARAKGFSEGAAAMKALLLDKLQAAHPNGRMLVYEVVEFVKVSGLPLSNAESDGEGSA